MNEPFAVTQASATCRARAWQVGLAAVMVFVLDQWSKYFIVIVLGMGSRPPIRLNAFMAIVMAWNKGVSFSMLTSASAVMPYVLTGLAVLVSVLLVRLALQSTVLWERIGYGMVVGGALGNALDRLRHGAVADFFYVHIEDAGFPAFNIADSGICIGVGLLLLCMMKTKARP